MRSDKHILWLTPGFPGSVEDDSTTPTIQNLALAFKRAHPEITLTIVSIHFPFAPDAYVWNEISVHAAGGANARYPMRFFVWRRVRKLLEKIHSEKRIDLIHSFWYSEAALLANRFCKKNNLPHACTLMGQDVQQSNRYLNVLRKAQMIKVAISERAANDFKQSTGTSVEAIIPFGVEPVAEQHALRTIDVLGVGSFIKLKRFDWFLEIVAAVKVKHPQLKVTLVGDGAEMETLRKMISENELGENVTLSGWLKRKEVLNLMARSKIFLHTAESEGMGYVFAEAAARGCYLASTPVGIASSSESWFVSEDKTQLEKQISTWLETELKFKSRVMYAIEDTANAYVELYEKEL